MLFKNPLKKELLIPTPTMSPQSSQPHMRNIKLFSSDLSHPLVPSYKDVTSVLCYNQTYDKCIRTISQKSSRVQQGIQEAVRQADDHFSIEHLKLNDSIPKKEQGKQERSEATKSVSGFNCFQYAPFIICNNCANHICNDDTVIPEKRCFSYKWYFGSCYNSNL